MARRILTLLLLMMGFAGFAQADTLRGTNDLAVIIEREKGSVLVVDTTAIKTLFRVEGLGDLSHGSVNFSRDGRYAFVFGRDGGLSKIDILTGMLVKRVVQGGNSIGGAISADGRFVAVANYAPGGVRIFRTDTLEQIADIPAIGTDGKASKTVGLVDAPGNRFVFTLYDAGEIWMVGMNTPANPVVRRYTGIGDKPYDANITPDGRYYLAGLFGEDGVALLDLWNPDKGVKRILNGYGKGQEPLPVYKMPHLEGWAMGGSQLVLPAVGRFEILAVNTDNWTESWRVAVQGQPVFVVSRPDNRHLWVNFAHPANSVVQVVDVVSQQIIRSFEPGKVVLHIEFSPRGEQAWVSARDSDQVIVYDSDSFAEIGRIAASKPSGIFMSARAGRIGQ